MAGQGTVTIKILGNADGAISALSGIGTKVDGVAGKFGTLGKAVAGIGIAAGVVAIGKGLYDVGEQFDEAYDKIRTNTGKTGEALEGLKDDFRRVVQDVPTDFGKASDAIALVTQKLGLTGPALDTISEQFLELSRITKTDLTTNLNDGLSALNNWNIPADQMSTVLDQMFRASQLTGVSFDTLANGMNTSGAQLRALGFEFGDSIALVGQLGKAGIDVSEVMPALSKSMAVAGKEGKSAGDLFQETFDKIKNAPTDTEAAGDALKVFGAKAGPKFAELIREGRLEYTDLLTQIQTGSDTILAAGKDTQDFSEKWELFKNRVLVKLEPLAAKVFDALGKAMDDLPGIMARLQPWFDKIAASATAVVSFFVTNWPKVQKAVDATVSWITGTGWPALRTVFDAIEVRVAQLVDWWEHHWNAIHDAVRNVLIALAVTIRVMLTPLLLLWNHFGEQITAVVTYAWNLVQNIVETALRIISDTIALFVDLLSGNWGKAWDDVKDILAAAWEGIKTGVQDGVQFVLDFFSSLPANIISAIGDLAGQLYKIGLAALNGLWDGIKAVFGNVVDWFADLPRRIKDAIGDLSSLLLGVGADLAKGFMDGIKSALQSGTDIITGSAGGAPALNPGGNGSGSGNPIIDPRRPGGQARIGQAGVTMNFHAGSIVSNNSEEVPPKLGQYFRAASIMGN